MTRRDDYYNRAKQEGYRARSAYKLKQLDDTAGVLPDDGTVVDLGAAPGGWLQVAAERVGPGGTVIGVDRQRIDPVDAAATVETIRGDMTDGETIAAITDRADGVDAVCSDLAPNMTGEYSVDHARSIHLARQAFSVAEATLAAGGDFVAKVFDGPDLDDFEADIEASFEYVRRTVPEASRDSSSELYLIGKGYLTAPVRAGDRRTVEIVDAGDEGDGIARIDGFALFVPATEVGETVEIRVDEVKPTYGFAQRIDD
ncbi:23S rRNA (uridine(2552)-2'-O)-methyltransferase [Halobacteriales archaeon SW_7_68_16]|nr:MAG: 23S rRNA (uridine(2552)-2'-O)-methyltransferase [Halobacteriales archaeon SW_7_68_16]